MGNLHLVKNFIENVFVSSKCSAMHGSGLAMKLTAKVFQLERLLLFLVLQINNKRDKEVKKGAFLWIFALASSSVRTQTFVHKS